MSTVLDKSYQTFAEFYPAYLSEHSNRMCRELHFAGSTLAIVLMAAMFITGNPWCLLGALLSGYGFAWIGHFWFEKNQPVSFRHPFYSFASNWVMY